MYKRSLTICALMSLVLCGNKAIAQDYSNLEDIYNEPIYSLKDSANDANTTLSVKLYTLGDNGRISEEITKYVNINKTTTEKDGTTYDLTYNWDDNTKKLSVSPSGLQIKNNGDYIGNSAGWGSAVAITTDTDLVEGNIIGNWTTNIGGQVTVKNGARLEKLMLILLQMQEGQMVAQ